MKHLFAVIIALWSLAPLHAQNDYIHAKQVFVRVDGLSCPFCAYGLEKKLKQLDNVQKVVIDLEKGLATITLDEKGTLPEDVIRKKVEQAGFTPKEITYSEESGKKDGNENP